MDITGKSQKEIQDEIFQLIGEGANSIQLKEELRSKGLPVEGYYFTSKDKFETTIQSETYSPSTDSSGGVSAWQVFVTILAIAFLIFRIVRCNERMKGRSY